MHVFKNVCNKKFDALKLNYMFYRIFQIGQTQIFYYIEKQGDQQKKLLACTQNKNFNQTNKTKRMPFQLSSSLVEEYNISKQSEANKTNKSLRK